IATSSFSFFLFFFILCRSFALADTDEVDYKASKQQQADRVVRLPGQPLSTSATTPATCPSTRATVGGSSTGSSRPPTPPRRSRFSFGLMEGLVVLPSGMERQRSSDLF
ncbi:unnamed protein product, partial [Musa acuminata subsp. malaccensis]